MHLVLDMVVVCSIVYLFLLFSTCLFFVLFSFLHFFGIFVCYLLVAFVCLFFSVLPASDCCDTVALVD